MAFVLVVNPFIPGQKKKDKVMNMGVLAVASTLAQEYDVQIVDYYANPDTPISTHISYDTKVVAFSCSGAESYRESIKQARIIKHEFPNICILMGGQHISGLFQSNMLPLYAETVDCYIPGPCEKTLLDVCGKIRRGETLDSVMLGEDLRKIGFMNYELYPNWQEMIPCVEIGRGCNHNCHFCNSQNMRKISKYICRGVEDVIQETRRIISLYGSKTDIFLFGSIFGENTIQTRTVLEELKKIAPEAQYTFNLRSDSRWEKYIDAMKELHIRLVFLGIESASIKILELMNKTKNPYDYLERTQSIIKVFGELNIPFFSSFILGYWGETEQTIAETFTFIKNNKDYFKAIGVNQYYVYPGSTDYDHISELAKVYRCKINCLSDIQSYSIEKQGEITSSEIQNYCNILENQYNDQEYFEKVRSWRFM